MNNVQAAEALLMRNADPDIVCPCGCTVLHHAVRDSNSALVYLLVDYGADPDARKLHSGDTAVHIAAAELDPDILDVIESFEVEVDYNAINDDGDSPLHIAIAENSDAMVEKLLSLGATPDYKAYRMAASAGALAIFEAMIDIDDLEPNVIWKLALIAESNGHQAIARAIMEHIP
jgi:ankyrin repeat protein